MEINWTSVIIAAIGLIFSGILLPVAKNFIAAQKSKMTAEQLQVFDYWSKKFITVAEIIFDGVAQGANKKDWVISKLLEYGIIKYEDVDAVSDFIDAICQELTKEGLINTKKAMVDNKDQLEIIE